MKIYQEEITSQRTTVGLGISLKIQIFSENVTFEE
jgi:hypothetical protein